jgi:hypothetical protein
LAPEIQSEIISKSAIKLFVPLFNHEIRQMKKNCLPFKQSTADIESLEPQERWTKALECYARGVTVFVDNKVVSPDFTKHDHPITGQMGLFAFISLTELNHGSHQINITKSASSEEIKTAEIRFYFSPE